MRTAVIEKGSEAGTEEERLEQLKLKISELEASLTALVEREARLTAEREPLVLKATVDRDAAAQERKRALDRELFEVRQDKADYESALAEVKSSAIAAEQAIVLRDWEAQRAAVRKVLQKQLKMETLARVAKATRELIAALKNATDEDDAAEAMLRQFTSKINASGIRMVRRSRRRVCSEQLAESDMLAIDRREIGRDSHSFEWLEGPTREAYEGAIEALDSLELVF
jgi:hypothetical protein